MNQPDERDDRDTDPAPPPEPTDVLCSGCAAVLVIADYGVKHPDPTCEAWRHRHAAGLARGATK
jgi:hypothetical protein